jgi:hypothetical protein
MSDPRKPAFLFIIILASVGMAVYLVLKDLIKPKK